jgi:hypothetical protein
MLSLGNLPFLNNVMRKVGGESVGHLPEGKTLTVIDSEADRPRKAYNALQQHSTEDQLEVNQVESLLSETTPPPIVDESQCDHDHNSIDPGQELWNVDTDVASDCFPPATSSVHTSSSGEVILGTPDKPSAAAQKRPQRQRGRPAGVKNKPKTKVEDAAPRPRRGVQKRAREPPLSSSDSDTFDLQTPIVVRVNQPPAPKRTRRTKATVANITTAEEGRQHVERQRQKNSILQNFSADLQSFLDHLNDQGTVSGLYYLLKLNSQLI